MKKILLLLLIFALVLGSLYACDGIPGGKTDDGESDNGAVEEKKPTEGLAYMPTEDGRGYIVTGIGTATDTDVLIPSEHEGKPVLQIANSAFENCTSLKSVEVPTSVEAFGWCCFAGCASLESLTIPFAGASREFGNFTYLFGFTPFEGAVKVGESLLTTYYPATLTTVTITDSETINERTFEDCVTLKKIVLSEGVKGIDHYAFQGCTSLTSIELPNSMTTIGVGAFMECTSLTAVVLPGSLTTMEDFAFYGCKSLASIQFDGTTAMWENVSKGELWNHECANKQVACSKNESTGSGEAGNDGSGDSGGDSSGSGNGGSSGGTVAGNPAGTVYSEGSYTYTSHGDGTCAITNWTPNISARSYVLNFPTTTQAGERITEIGRDVFNHSRVASVRAWPQYLTTIGEMAFAYCEQLTTLSLPSSVTKIDIYAFYQCTALTNVTLSSSLLEIGDYAFRGCSALPSITIPASVTTIGIAPFLGSGIPNPKGQQTTTINVTVASGNRTFAMENNCLVNKNTRRLIMGFAGCSIPSGIKVIGAYAFSNMYFSNDLAVDTSLTKIEAYAFYGVRLKWLDYSGTFAQWERVTKGEKWDGRLPGQGSGFTVRING